MRCVAYCTAKSYNLAKLFDLLKHDYPTTLYLDTIHASFSQKDQDMFFFPYGVVIFWGLIEEEELKILNILKAAENEPLYPIEQDYFDFSYGENQIKRDHILLKQPDILSKLAVSHGLAQSTKLTTFEHRIDQTIAKTSHLPRDLSEKGRIFLSRKQMSRKIGELFLDRSSVNLQSNILDEPEFFWEYPEHQPIYRDTVKCLDLTPRIEVLNTRLSLLNDLLQILSDQLNHQHTSILEWTIIWLILIEVILAVLRDLLHII
jgi:uncharacterized Rmd1/YagE family protein